MYDDSQEHVAAIEAKERAERQVQAEQQQREEQIAQCRSNIARAEARKQGPFFTGEDAERTYLMLKNAIEVQADEYVRNLCAARQTAKPIRLDLASAQALAFFFGPALIQRLPELAERINQRNGRAVSVDDATRNTIIARSDAEIASNQVMLDKLLSAELPTFESAGE